MTANRLIVFGMDGTLLIGTTACWNCQMAERSISFILGTEIELPVK